MRPVPLRVRRHERVEIMGVPIDSVTEEEAIDHIISALAEHQGGWVVTPNIDVLRMAARDSAIRDLVTDADLVLADGMPLIWASRLQRLPLPARVPGSTLVWTLSEAASKAGASVFLLGGNPGAAERAAEALTSAMPALVISGHHCPPMGFESSPAEMQEIVRQLEASKPDIVYCGFGFPKQERLIAGLRQRFPSTWFLGIGISLSFVGGEIMRSPQWMQDRGLEWMHRLSREPRRLFSRYIVHDIPFAMSLLTRAAVAGCASPRRRSLRLLPAVAQVGAGVVVMGPSALPS